MRRVTLRRRCGAPGKPRHCEVETAPEKMHRAGFADKTGAKFFQNAIGLDQSLPEFMHIDKIVLRMGAVLFKPYRVLDLARHGPDANVDVEAMQPFHELGVE